MATGNFDVLSEGFGNLGAALSGVGGIEGKRQQLLQQMRAEAEMAQLQKAAELKQQAEDNARAYAEAQQREFERELLAAQGNELPTSGASNADVIRAALNPAPGQMRGGLDPTRAAALFARLDPKAGAGIYNSNLDRRAEYGVDPTPKFEQFTKESNSRVGENEASAYSHRQSGYASNMLGKRRVEETRRAATIADWANEQERANYDVKQSLIGQRDSAASLSDEKANTERDLRGKKVAKLEAQIDAIDTGAEVDEARIRKIENDITNDNTLLPAERQVLIEKADALKLRGLLDKAKADSEVSDAKAYADYKGAQVATEKKKQEKIEAEKGIVGVVDRAKAAALGATARLTGAKADEAEVKAKWAEANAEQDFDKKLAQIDAAKQQHEFAANRTLTEKERLEVTKKTKELLDGRIKGLERAKDKDAAQVALLKMQAGKIAYVLANPGMDQVRDLSRALSRAATDPRASTGQRREATQQLMQLLDRIPGFEVSPGETTETWYGGTKQGPPSIQYTPPGMAETLRTLEQLGAPTRLYADEGE